jgi:hypothetical protein
MRVGDATQQAQAAVANLLDTLHLTFAESPGQIAYSNPALHFQSLIF